MYNRYLNNQEGFERALEDLTFIATFEPHMKPSFYLKKNCSTYIDGFTKFFYAGEDKNTTYNRIDELIRYIEQFLNASFRSREEEDQKKMKRLLTHCQKCILGLDNLYVTYPYSGFRDLAPRVRFILNEYGYLIHSPIRTRKEYIEVPMPSHEDKNLHL